MASSSFIGGRIETSAMVRERVTQARQCQLERQGCLNAHLDNRRLQQVCKLDAAVEARLVGAIDKLRLSARSYHKLLRLARSIADLGHCADIDETHLAEAISYRQQDRRRA